SRGSRRQQHNSALLACAYHERLGPLESMALTYLVLAAWKKELPALAALLAIALPHLPGGLYLAAAGLRHSVRNIPRNSRRLDRNRVSNRNNRNRSRDSHSSQDNHSIRRTTGRMSKRKPHDEIGADRKMVDETQKTVAGSRQKIGGFR